MARVCVLTKTTDTINSVARNTSCSGGWLRLVMQICFGCITILSFVLITVMALRKSPLQQDVCFFITGSCILTCFYTPQYERDIYHAVSAARPECRKVQLSLTAPIFENNTLSENWMNTMPPLIDTLNIVGGNLMHISDRAFASSFATRVKQISFEDITLSSWTSNTFAGLSNLNTLIIKNSKIENIDEDSLSSVANTIDSIIISGISFWQPDNVTGSTSAAGLQFVSLSNNNFSNILGPKSFRYLRSCQILFLNLNHITFIEEGTFDNMVSLKVLYLNDNFLTTLSPNLFHNFFNLDLDDMPKIDLRNNNWICDCAEQFISQLVSNNLLIGNPICSNIPYHGIAFSRFVEICNHDMFKKSKKRMKHDGPNTQIDFKSAGVCHFGTKIMPFPMQLVSLSPHLECDTYYTRNFDRNTRSFLEKNNAVKSNEKRWLHPTLSIQRNTYSMVQLGTNSLASNYGLLWYQSKCPNEFYCFNIYPHILRLYDIDVAAKYTFCPIELNNSYVDIDNCVSHNISDIKIAPDPYDNVERPLLYVVTGILCLAFGALIVYIVIRMNPYLLKGSKKLLFVKHKSVEALVLPPKVPLRSSQTLSSALTDIDSNNIYTVSANEKFLFTNEIVRSNSVRSDKSNSPTYISVLQPTEAQMAEWRLRHHFHTEASISSISSETSTSTILWNCERQCRL